MTQPTQTKISELSEQTRIWLEEEGSNFAWLVREYGEPLDQARQAFLVAFVREAGK